MACPGRDGEGGEHPGTLPGGQQQQDLQVPAQPQCGAWPVSCGSLHCPGHITKAVTCFFNSGSSLVSWGTGEEAVVNAGALQSDSNSSSLLKGARQGLAWLCSGGGQQLEESAPI